MVAQHSLERIDGATGRDIASIEGSRLAREGQFVAKAAAPALTGVDKVKAEMQLFLERTAKKPETNSVVIVAGASAAIAATIVVRTGNKAGALEKDQKVAKIAEVQQEESFKTAAELAQIKLFWQAKLDALSDKAKISMTQTIRLPGGH